MTIRSFIGNIKKKFFLFNSSIRLSIRVIVDFLRILRQLVYKNSYAALAFLIPVYYLGFCYQISESIPMKCQNLIRTFHYKK
jgi:hypothetical protein